MTDVTTSEPERIPAFPKEEIETSIRECLAHEGEMQAVLRGSGTSSAGSSGSVGARPSIDSLVVVSILCEIEPTVPFDLPESFVRPGGYETVDDVIQDIMPKLEMRWREHQRRRVDGRKS